MRVIHWFDSSPRSSGTEVQLVECLQQLLGMDADGLAAVLIRP